ncbi:MAG: methylmalonyl Co-A mutase-associated GTPase MeaB [Rhodospirillaceae bacterium]|nr:methylmalonyl Co-A mutase-associated GTPase MeaB [Magnetovibrio sp.]MAY68392.1 methylmalonyl Co-A mutase-associated GTPase MeaB [Rhodospirillaceae bacterium]
MAAPKPDPSPDLLAAAQGGDRRAIAKLLSLAETTGSAASKSGATDSDLMARVYQAAGSAHVVGVTGPPGAGKSSLVNALVKELRRQDLTVGVIAIDPSSPFSGGAILGDRVRMGDHGGDNGVFIRSLATQGAMGGLARPALDSVDVLDACGFQVVMIETVGVGQDEVDVAAAAHTVIVASPPGLGDGVQAMKAGILEIADIHVVTKADRADADQTAADLAGAQDLGLTGRQGRGDGATGWRVPVIATSANTGNGVADLAQAVRDHGAHLAASGEDKTRRRRIALMRLESAALDHMRREFKRLAPEMADLIDDLAARRADPRTAARLLMEKALTPR